MLYRIFGVVQNRQIFRMMPKSDIGNSYIILYFKTQDESKIIYFRQTKHLGITQHNFYKFKYCFYKLISYCRFGQAS